VEIFIALYFFEYKLAAVGNKIYLGQTTMSHDTEYISAPVEENSHKLFQLLVIINVINIISTLYLN